ncbi:MAG: hypothetical protein KIT14_04025 [bacterium]|nr:hypothetical protein [bacterium]
MAPHAGCADAHRGARRLSAGGRARVCALVAAVVLLAARGADASEPPVPLGPCGPIDRLHAAVELRAMQLRRLKGTPLAHLGLVAWRDGVAVPIPFQVDERRGSWMAMSSGPEPSTDDTPGSVDADDVLVFMACDAGGRAPGGTPAATAGREIRIDDPRTGTTAWAYLMVADDPPRTTRRYVDYDPQHDMVRTAGWRIGMIQALPEYLALGLGGPLGPNILDGLRLRAEARLRGNLARFTLSERDGEHALAAWTAGPVRVVRRSRHAMQIGLGLHLAAGYAHTYFYALHAYGPGKLKLPFSPSVFFNDIRAFAGADLHDLEGWRYLAAGVPAPGFAIDGTMDAAERAFRGAGSWFALTHPGAAVVVSLWLSDNLRAAIPLDLVYRDDAATAAPPERVRGSVPFVGIEGREAQRLQAGRYEFALRVYGIPGWKPGDERRLLADLDAPLRVHVTRPVEFGAGPGARR